MFENIYQLSPKKVSAVEWTGDSLHYDFQLFGLGKGHREFWAINPNTDILEQWNTDLKFYVDTIPDTRKCVVLSYQGEWIVKVFKQDWYPYHGYENIEIVKPKIVWSYNSDVDLIEIKHLAHNREGFALGAVIAAEWILGKKGVFTMKDVLNIGNSVIC